MVFTEAVLFFIGLVLLVKGSDFFVASAMRISKRLGVSEFVIGPTLVAFGTSLPEMGASIVASIKHQSGIVVGNVLGSNVANIGLIMGIVAVLWVLKTNSQMLKRDGYIMLFAAVLFYIFLFNGVVSRIEGSVFLVLYVVYVLFVIETASKSDQVYHFKDFITYFFKFSYIHTISKGFFLGNYKGKKGHSEDTFTKGGILKELGIIVLSIIAICYGAKFLVEEAVFFAKFFHVPQTLIGLSLIAIGTSLPELAVSLSAARKGFGNIVVGNVIGSNIANIFLIIGVSSIISPLAVIKSTIFISAPFMIFMTLLFLFFMLSRKQLERIEAIILLLLYGFFLSYMFVYGSKIM
ncbi:MAG: calcium/sodium antiporter [Deltaproteobacteria bacterium]|nr:calcium/sodium antiporter [Deltaproteobacteria bacterium]